MSEKENLKIGMYTENDYFELFREHTLLGRSMYDAIFDKIHTQITEIEQLQSQLQEKEKIIEDAIKYIKNNNLYHYEYDKEELFEIVVSNKKELLSLLERK